MFKFLIILLVLGYVLRRVLFTPLNQPPKKPVEPQKTKSAGYSDKAGEYTDYEEIK